ncbi:MAG: group II intron reverse transcriptase domain-containing protein [Nitrospira sp.]|nr:group II intron reverse transcriptase domain-containing protein [Nitrospira sp.]MCB9710729.1 group II intron reverse transcriptase domain-containing protein [Nitrospiraceae bacterium]
MGAMFDRLTAFPNLLRAAYLAQRGKRRRPNVSTFFLNLETELVQVQTALRTRTYQPGPFRNFVIREKKPRMISAAPFRDRVVHHALCQVIEPLFERRFLFDSYACRKGKGTHAAVDRASSYARRYRYVLKCDLAQFFPSIDHQVLLGLLQRRVQDPEVLWVITRILGHGGSERGPVWYFPGDDLLAPWTRSRGLPIGNQTSQFFGNVYLDPLDHVVKESLRCPGYVRYVDDFLLFADSKAWLHEAHAAVEDVCASLRVRLHARKCVVAPVSNGVTFLGYRLFPGYRRLDAGNVKRARRRFRRYDQEVRHGMRPAEQARACVQSWVAHAQHANTYRLCERLLADFPWWQARGKG